MQIFVSDRNYYHHGQQTEGVCLQLSGEATRRAEEDFGEGDGEKEMGILKQNKIVQEVKKFKSPAAKKAMSFLLDTKDDWDDCMKQFELLLDGDGNLIPLEEDNKDKVDAFLKFIVQFGNKRVRKTKREMESYEIANSSAHGWLTEQCYNQQNMFQSGLSQGSSNWYDTPYEPPAKKAKRLFDAEMAAASIARSRETKDDESDEDCDY